jgi:hypothetical protein
VHDAARVFHALKASVDTGVTMNVPDRPDGARRAQCRTCWPPLPWPRYGEGAIAGVIVGVAYAVTISIAGAFSHVRVEHGVDPWHSRFQCSCRSAPLLERFSAPLRFRHGGASLSIPPADTAMPLPTALTVFILVGVPTVAWLVLHDVPMRERSLVRMKDAVVLLFPIAARPWRAAAKGVEPASLSPSFDDVTP